MFISRNLLDRKQIRRIPKAKRLRFLEMFLLYNVFGKQKWGIEKLRDRSLKIYMTEDMKTAGNAFFEVQFIRMLKCKREKNAER
jgi:hypothetical protein